MWWSFITAIFLYLILAPISWFFRNIHKIIIVVCIVLITMKILNVGIFKDEDNKVETRQVVSTRI